MKHTALLAGAVACLASAAAARPCPPHDLPHAATVEAGAPYLDPTGAVRLVGYNDMAEMIAGLDRAFEATHPGLRMAPVLQGTRTAPPALAAGTSLLAPMGAPFSLEELAAYRRATGGDPLVFRVAHASMNPSALSGPLAIFVHADNPLRAASLPRLASLFTDGRVHTWGELGLTGAWAARPIHVTGLAAQTALALELQARLFPGRSYAQGFSDLKQSADVVRQVADDPLALGFAALNRSSGSVRALALSASLEGRAVAPTAANVRSGRYPLDRHLLIYARPGPDGRLVPLARDYLTLVLSCEGQAIIGSGSLGYMPLNSLELAAERARLR